MPPTTVTVRVPATSANLGPGFDALGLALDVAGQVQVRWSERPARFPDGRADQLALAAARLVWERAGRPAPAGLQVAYQGDIPVGRGLGASAVLRVGGIVGANALLGEPFGPDDLLRLATELEGHADNAAPALFGGFQVCVRERSGAISRVQAPLPDGLHAVVLVPDLDMPTSESRRLLPETLSRRDCVHNIGRAALLVAALATGRLDLLAVATEDVLHQPARSKLFPEMYDIFQAARGAGALCAYLSGGGSSIMAFATEGAERIGDAMLARARAAGRSGRVIVTRPSARGAEIVERG